MIAIEPPVRFLDFSLASKGPSTHDPSISRGPPAIENQLDQALCVLTEILGSSPRMTMKRRPCAHRALPESHAARLRNAGKTQASIFNAARKADCGISTLPN
jgi:hypothetical protein